MHRTQLDILISSRRDPGRFADADFGEFAAAIAVTTMAVVIVVVTVVALRSAGAVVAAGFDGWEDVGEEEVEDGAAAGEAGADDADVGFDDSPEGGDYVVYMGKVLVLGPYFRHWNEHLQVVSGLVEEKSMVVILKLLVTATLQYGLY
jgi:hypothetical protein